MPNVLGVPQSARTIVDTYIAGEAISALKIVRLDSPTTVKIGDSSSTYEDAKVIGVAISAAALGVNIDVQSFGELNDAFFSFPLNAPLYLSPTGTITDTPPTSGYNVQIGHSLGAGSIFVKVQEPIELF